MADAVAVLGLAGALFVATNLDDVFLLIALFADPRLRATQVLAGQLLGMSVLIAASVAGAKVALAVAPEWVGLLGLAPLALGLRELAARMRRRRAQEADADDDDNPRLQRAGVLSVTLVTIASGGDNLGIYVPVFATRATHELALIAVVFLVLTTGLCVAARSLVHHPKLGAPIRRYIGPLTPYVLIALGLYVLADSALFDGLG